MEQFTSAHFISHALDSLGYPIMAQHALTCEHTILDIYAKFIKSITKDNEEFTAFMRFGGFY